MIDLIGELRRIMNRDAAETFDLSTDSLEAIRDFLVSGGAGSPGLVYYGVVTLVVNPTTFDAALLVGHGDSYFNGYSVYVVRDAAGAGAPPQGRFEFCTGYVSINGRFTHIAFSTGLTIGDEVLLLHPALVVASHVVKVGRAALGSGAAVLVDPVRTEASGYWQGLQIGMITGANAGLVRPIATWDGPTNTFLFIPPFPFAIALLDIYVLIARFSEVMLPVPGMHNHANNTAEQIVFTIPAVVAEVETIYLDLTALTQNADIRVYHQIALALVVIETFNWTTGMDDGVYFRKVAIDDILQVTLRSLALEGAIRDVPWKYLIRR